MSPLFLHDIRDIGNMATFTPGGSIFPLSLSTHCSPPVGGFRMSLIAFPNILMNFWPLSLCIFDAMPVTVCNSSVRALKCALSLRFGTWQCYWKKLGRPWNSVRSCFRYIIYVASIVVSQWPQIPSICVSRCPRAPYRQSLIDYRFASQGGKWVPIPIVWSFKCLMCRYVWVNSQCPE